MLNLSRAERVIIVGGGTAGWLAALEMRLSFPSPVEILVIESEKIGIIGAGEGSIPNFELALKRYGIDRAEFMNATQATFKLGVCFEGWRGTPEDRYLHLFSTMRDGIGLMDWQDQGFFPGSSYLMSQGVGLDQYPDSRRLIDEKASQEAVLEHISRNPSEPFAYHFDARRLAAFLRMQAELRGVLRIDAVVAAVEQDEQGNIAAVQTDGGRFAGDFFVDASGFARLLVGKTLGVQWESFSDSLLLDAALPFMMPTTEPHPALTTLSKAMHNGWMWVIPTQGRLGCGYVYSSAHTTEEEVLRELESVWGEKITPINRLRFSPGRLQKCLVGNAMAVGLSSGFVEPLEATSIAQTIYQVAFFGSLIQQTHGVVPDRVLDVFNADVANCWDGILDFLVLHYDQARCDTEFWQDVRKSPKPSRYLDLREALQYRTPRGTDLAPYHMGGNLIFGVSSWESVGSSMGIVSRTTAARQLARLGPTEMSKLKSFSSMMVF